MKNKIINKKELYAKLNVKSIFIIKNKEFNQSEFGFTLIEILIAIFVLGILAAIAAPSWLEFVNARRLNIAQEQVYQAMRTAQSRAKQERQNWQASFRERNRSGVINLEWAVHPAIIDVDNDNNDSNDLVNWNSFDPNIRFSTVTSLQSRNNVRYIQFNHKGHVNGLLRRITVSTENSSSKRCVFASTLLGALRTAKDAACS
ncbi:type II secretion system protein [Gloeocapsopsis sp. IPPAS B-1203]|uniref:pilus assembly FimT family protein n=1 Tax=Gloeocapsopsis sp. IPPAS B-1203 TaxID=2049454 RepID=UPI000C17599B|nr:type II secretion system protein [Gloeocapsopsis sp. IPPAS B-1203]PIG91372.1 prepilin-type cleavage/methylation domain-containing protein [Gloeocapsopsis sp. IPPAS B-1203]